MEIILNKEETNFFIELGINKALIDTLEEFESKLGIPDRKIPSRKMRGGGLKR